MTAKVDLENVLATMSDPRKGLSDEVFHFIRKVTPLINVDLLIRRNGRTLLAWREDEYDTGWHIPGGIIRFREDFRSRIDAVARIEIGATVESEAAPCNIAELREHDRGHFVSLLYRCSLTSELDPARMYLGEGRPANGELSWIEGLPKDFYPAQLFYGDWLEGKR
ncbi:NUDIX hydrolase [Bradyrhizobium canariense]|uniref:NUDIX hydrolase n=1 Tax=Bradyrhizobium canariense TaxID=255045 RepID=UPI001CA4B7AF|nr:NUDIX hydrolase [Bradyrhizobium canariense]MBW5435822.1 NUDIX hydrolase [Bradyrhizobium canariense]